MTLETLEETLLSACDELLLLDVVSAIDAEADVHTAANAGIGHNLVHLRVLIQSTVDELRLLVGDGLLAANLLSAEFGHQIGHHLAGNPEVEDGESVIQGVVLGGGSEVEDHGAGETTDVQSLQESRGGSGGLGREKVLADDGDGDTSDTDVLLCTTL